MSDNNTETLLTASNLTLSFSDTTAVDEVSISVERGQVLGLLGLNGAGKTSTLRMLAGIQAPGSGDVLIDGISLAQAPLRAKQKIGYLPEIAPLYPDMRVMDYLLYTGRLRRLSARQSRVRTEQLLETLELEAFAKRVIGKLSKGYKQRVGLAQALVHDPALLILDEPSSGLDPEQMRDMRQLIKSLAADKGVIFSSHLLGEVNELCDSVSVLHHGRLVYHGELHANPGTAAEMESRFIAHFASPVSHAQLSTLQEVKQAESVKPNTWSIQVTSGRGQQLLAALVNAGLPLVEFASQKPSLDTLFASLVGREGSSSLAEAAGT